MSITIGNLLNKSLNFLIFCILGIIPVFAGAQRVYKSHSVLASGTRFKVGITAPGVYKMDVSFLKSLGINGALPSAQIRLYGNGGGMLPERNSQPRPDDLEENSIYVSDGGDGLLDGADYVLFYAQGPHQWVFDSSNHRFTHKKNIYSDTAYYYITVGGTGKRIAQQPSAANPVVTVNAYDERFYHELDSVNFLSSGKEWYGEEFSNLPGRALSRAFAYPGTGAVPGAAATLVTSVAARSVGVTSRFSVSSGTQVIQQTDIQPVGSGVYDLFAQQATTASAFSLDGAATVITFSYAPGSFNSQGWLNWFELLYRRSLALPSNQQLLFRDLSSMGNSSVLFTIANTGPEAQVWDVTDPLQPASMRTSVASGTLSFSNEAIRLHEYVCFDGTFPVPVALGRVANQDLHQTGPADLFIVTPQQFLPEARRIAQFHQTHDQLRAVIVTPDQIYNEFASGAADPTALRDFLKMYYDRYRAQWQQSGKYLLLLGRASYDYKNRLGGNAALVPCYESAVSLDPLSTYTSDDYFGFLDDQEDINSGVIVNQLDLGIGRVPARDAAEAKNFVDKMLDYNSPAAFGPWRNQLTFVADDGDNNLHLQDAEALTGAVQDVNPLLNLKKIYLDAFQKQTTPAGGNYPQVNAAINSDIYNGTLIWNYTGHGGPQRLAEETVVDQQAVNSWNNPNRLPLFITATCDFAAFDQPLQSSLGENLVVRPRTGAIGLLTTTRVVFAYSNLIIHTNYLNYALKPDSSGNYRTLGEAVRLAKNLTYTASGDVINNRKFTLLGDPAMRLAFPDQKLSVIALNGVDLSQHPDTLKATDLVNITGEVTDRGGQLLSDFQGTVYATLYDKPQTVSTQGNDPGSFPVNFQTRENVLFKGKVSAKSGLFTLRFKMPRDMNYQYGNGKLSLYANDASRDGSGFTTQIIIGGIGQHANNDKQGPVIKAFLNDDQFVNGSITNISPVLLLYLSDSSGINTGSTGIDHDMVATLDNDNRNYYVLNNYYETDLDSYQKGTVRFQLPTLAAGKHELKIKVWDVMDNSSEYVLDFVVAGDGRLQLDHVLNYPNPFTSRTSFWFEHNLPGVDLYVKVEIFTVTGKLVKTITKTINTTGNRSNEVEWDGRDQYENKLGRGVYLYRIIVRTPDGKTATKWERLALL